VQINQQHFSQATSTHSKNNKKGLLSQMPPFIGQMKLKKQEMAQAGYMTHEEYKCYCQGLEDALQFIKRSN